MGAAAIPAGMAVAGGAYSAYSEGEAGKANASYYNYLSSTAKINAGLAEAEGTSEKKQLASQEANEQVDLTNRINSTVGTQKAAVVNGVGASSRSAQDIISDTLNKGNLDEMALRLNTDNRIKNADITAKSAAMNFGTQAAGFNIAGTNAIGAAKGQQIGSLLQAGGSVANSWYMGKMYAGRGYGGQGSIGSAQ